MPAYRTHSPCLSCTDARFVSRGVIRLPCAQCETGSSGSVQGWHRRASKLLLASMLGLDALSLCATRVTSWLVESRFEKREVSRHVVSYGHGHLRPRLMQWSTSRRCDGASASSMVDQRPTIAPRDRRGAMLLYGDGKWCGDRGGVWCSQKSPVRVEPGMHRKR